MESTDKHHSYVFRTTEYVIQLTVGSYYLNTACNEVYCIRDKTTD